MIISSLISGIWARIHTIYYRPVTSATTNSNTDSAAGSHSCAQGNNIKCVCCTMYMDRISLEIQVNTEVYL